MTYVYPAKLSTFRIQNMNSFILSATLSCACFAICPSYVQAQALRAGIIGATRSMYNAEIKGIKNRSKLAPTHSEKNQLKGQKATPQNHQTQSKIINDYSEPVKSWPQSNLNPQITPKDNLTSNESELNANGWQSF